MHWRDIPLTFRLKGEDWTVRWVRDLRNPVRRSERLYGYCHPATRVILLDTGLRRTPRLLARKWAHELFHAAAPPGIDAKLEERLVLELEVVADLLVRRSA